MLLVVLVDLMEQVEVDLPNGTGGVVSSGTGGTKLNWWY